MRKRNKQKNQCQVLLQGPPHQLGLVASHCPAHLGRRPVAVLILHDPNHVLGASPAAWLAPGVLAHHHAPASPHRDPRGHRHSAACHAHQPVQCHPPVQGGQAATGKAILEVCSTVQCWPTLRSGSLAPWRWWWASEHSASHSASLSERA